MGKKLYVGNLPYNFNDASLEEVFGAFGAVESAKIIMDRDTGRSKGFGFVEMASDEDANSAIEKLNGSEQGGRTITVAEAKAKTDSRGGGRGRGFGGGRF